MQSSNTLHDTNIPLLRVLDIAYIVVLLPLLLIIKVPMLILMVIVVGLILSKKEMSNGKIFIVAMVGFFGLFLSLYGSFNFAGLSRLKLFLELLIYLLILAISLQRLTQKVNFYLLMSPVLLLALSLFFFHSIGMLVYVILEIFVLVWLILTYRMKSTSYESGRMALLMFVFSIPWVVVLFIFFPRISFDHASYGFRGEEIRRMGHDGTMYLDSKALLVPSDRIVMEVGFEAKGIPQEALYFRGSILYFDRKDHWEPLPINIKRPITLRYKNIEESIVYKVTLYPTKKRWLYLLDMPLEAPEGSVLDGDFVTLNKEKIDEPLRYQATSALKYDLSGELDAETQRIALGVDLTNNPQSAELAKEIEIAYKDPKKRAEALMQRFKKQNLLYSLKPKPLDLNHSVDSFLFENHQGYCVHFASSFVTMARMMGIPARVVTGYRGDRVNGIGNYLAIKERDAHAWAELFIGNKWLRYEPTSTASRIDEDSLTLLGQNANRDQSNQILAQINLYLMYAKYQIETWILNYSHFRQLQLLEKAKNNPVFVIKFVVIIGILVLLSLFLVLYLRRPVCQDKLLCLMEPLVDKIKKEGYPRLDGETMHQLLSRYVDKSKEPQLIQKIDQKYEQIRYAGDNAKDSLTEIGILIKMFLKIR